MKKLLITIIFPILFLTGCSDHSAIEAGILSSNKKVESLQQSSDTDYSASRGVERPILNGIKTGSLPSEISATTSVKFEDLNKAIIGMHADTFSCITENNLIAESDPKVSKLTFENILKDNTDIHYFLDDTTGTTEQYFVIRLNTKIYKLSLLWSGGACYEVKYATYN